MTAERIYPKGAPPPEGYLQWHQWARDQDAAGLRQTPCRECHRWLFPQEWEDHECESLEADK